MKINGQNGTTSKKSGTIVAKKVVSKCRSTRHDMHIKTLRSSVLTVILSVIQYRACALAITASSSNDMLASSRRRRHAANDTPGQRTSDLLHASIPFTIKSLRGGESNRLKNSLGANEDGSEISDQTSQRRRRGQQGMSVALAASYFTVMGAKCALPVVLPLLTSTEIGLTFPSNALPQQLIAHQLILATLTVALGKLVLGPVIDHLGGILSLKISLVNLAALLASIAFCQSFDFFGVAWIMVDFIFSSCWAACINAIHQSFPEQDWANQIGRLAAAARAGNSLAFMGFAYVLHIFQQRGMHQYWRPVFAAAAAAQSVPVLLLTIFGRQAKLSTNTSTKLLHKTVDNDNDKNSYHPSYRSSLATLKRVAATPDFWLHLVSRSVLMLFASFLLFVPTLMTQVYGTSSAVGAQVGSLYALGCLLSVSLSKMYPRLRRQGKLWMMTLLLLVGATGSSIAQLGHMSSWWTISSRKSAATMFVWGFSFAIPFYIPPSLYALSKGGKESSATIADVFDVGGFGLLAPFNGMVASWTASGTRSAWVPTFQITTACSIVSFLALTLAIRREDEGA